MKAEWANRVAIARLAIDNKLPTSLAHSGDRRAWQLQFFVHSAIGNSTNTNQPGPATRV
jgi:hypothetical protein